MPDYRELKREFYNEKFKRELRKAVGCTCSNCGSVENIEYHHIVPLSLGGTNRFSNIAPLCYFCHKIAHGAVNVQSIKASECGGRPRRDFPDNYEEIFWKYLRGEIGRKECYKLLGITGSSKLTDRPTFKEFLKENNIKHFKNSVDTYNQKRFEGMDLSGKTMSVITYKNGKCEKHIA